MAVEFRPYRSTPPTAVIIEPLGDVGRYLDNPSLETARKDERLLRRARWMFLPLAVIFAVLFARLWQLQIATPQGYVEQARLNRVRSIPIPPPRGVIFDRNQNPLATSVTNYSAAVVPAELQDADTTCALLGRLLRLQPSAISALIADSGRPRGYVPLAVKKRLTAAEVAAVEENRVRLPGVIVTPELVRSYLHGGLAPHVLGYVGEVSQAELDRRSDRQVVPGDFVGKLGLERMYDPHLLGKKGSLFVETDARGNPIGRVGEREERVGSSITLTLDTRLQVETERALAGLQRPGAAVLMRIADGDLLAIASTPRYDPNVFSPPMDSQLWRALSTNESRPLLNRAVSGLYPPGSTFKMITAAAALDAGAVTRTSEVVCDGALKRGNREFRCTGRHGAVSMERALAVSCNVYFMTIGGKVGETQLANYARRFRLGELTGIDLPRESIGTVPDPQWKRKRRREKWYPGDTLNMAIGQGFVLATPLQIAGVVSAVASGGRLPTPHLLKEVRQANGEVEARFTPQAHMVGVAPSALALIRQGMRQAVLGGTCTALNTPVVTVAAKTGSSQNTQGPKTHAWVAAFAPYEKPEIVCVVLMENAGHGGHAAAPIARRLLEAAFAKRRAPATPTAD